MGIFDDQIRQRMQGDQELFEDSILRMASAVVGSNAAGSMASGRIVTKEAVDDILKFYRINPVDIPSHVTDPEEQLEYALRPHGLMHRMVALTQGWHKDAFGPMIAYRASDGAPVPLFPKPYRGYWFRDETGRKVSVNARNAQGLAFGTYRDIGYARGNAAHGRIAHRRACVVSFDYLAPGLHRPKLLVEQDTCACSLGAVGQSNAFAQKPAPRRDVLGVALLHDEPLVARAQPKHHHRQARR